MSAQLQNIVNEFVMMWVLIDPIGTVPVFLLATQDMRAAQQRRIAIRASVTAAIVLVFFALGGQIFLRALGIPLTSFQIAGGIILFLFALTMVFGEPVTKRGTEEVEEASDERVRSLAVYPLAIPAIASPGAMLGAVMLVDAEHFSLVDQMEDVVIILVVVAITLAFMLAAKPVIRVMGDSGINVMGRVMGLILAAVAVDSVLVAIAKFFSIKGVPTGGFL
ncbi:MAG TPA: MarC family protein [Burkholderiales bacterium]|jgi:multiple antibiotic resistance protein|nr:MarC family protein [Burkholderiales bacterium]